MILYVSYSRMGSWKYIDEVNFRKVAADLMVVDGRIVFTPRISDPDKLNYYRSNAIAHRVDHVTITIVWPDSDPTNIKNDVGCGTMTLIWRTSAEVLTREPDSVMWLDKDGLFWPNFSWLTI